MTRDDAPAGRARDRAAKAAGASALITSEDRIRLLLEGITDYAIFMLDTGGHVASWDIGAQRLKGYRPEEIIGKHFSIFYPPEALARGWPEHELEVARRDGRFEDEGWRLRKDGSRFWANVVITRLRDSSGEFVGFAKVTRDLTDRRKQEEELRQSEERFRLLVEGARDYAIFMLDPDGHVLTWNAGAQNIKGYRADEILGRHFSTFYPPEALARGWPDHELEVARREGRFEDEGWRLRKDGTRFWANVIITALHDGTGRLRGFAKLTRDMTERKRMETLEHEGRQTTEFLAMLGHELRNPLASIRNAVEIIRAKEVSDPSVLWARDLIDRQLGHLTRLVDDLLDMSRITSGKVTLHQEPLDLALLVSRAAESTRPLFEQRKHELAVALPSEPLPVRGDTTRLSQVTLNLLNNAAKYTPEGGHVRVAVAKEGAQAVLRVTDDGIGMTPDLLPLVFNLFTQGERALDRSEGGLGIGLTLVRKLVSMHGGTVEASSPGPGRGSEFVVRLPALPSGSWQAAADAPASAPAPRKRRILVVDDNADAGDTMALLLQIWGNEVHVARDGPGALAAAAAHHPEIVLLDIGLPGMTGYEVAEQLREMPGMAGAALIAMTGYGQEEDRRRSREAGFAFHLVKPVPPDALQKLLTSLERPSDEAQA
jgi:PAS domain S-box-containing protein